MRKMSKPTVAIFAGLGAIALSIAPSFAAGSHGTTSAEAPIQLAHASNRGQQNQGGMNQNQQGQGMMNQGQQGQGMMNQGQQGQGMMGGGMMNMMRQHMMGQGTMGPNSGMGMGFAGQVVVSKDLTADDVSHFLEHRLEDQGNKRLTLGDVTEVDDEKITADITTVDGSLVQRLEIDRHSGKMQRVE